MLTMCMFLLVLARGKCKALIGNLHHNSSSGWAHASPTGPELTAAGYIRSKEVQRCGQMW